MSPEVLIIGAGTGGLAGALALAQAGRSVVITEPTSWVGGQLTSQAVPPDEHQWMENGIGATRMYRDFRTKVRDYFKATYPVTQTAYNNPRLDPGNHWSGRLSVEPNIWHAVFRTALKPHLDSGRIRLVTAASPTSATVTDGVVTVVRFKTPNGQLVVKPKYVVEASELGDLLPLAGIPYVVGREKGGPSGTGELHNKWENADPMCQSAFTVVAAVGYAPPKPGVPVSTPAYGEHEARYKTFERNPSDVFDPSRDWNWSEGRNFWQYRRVVFRGHLNDPSRGEIILLNQPQNDCIGVPLLPAKGPIDPAAFAASVQKGRDLTLGLVQYFQKTYRRPGSSGGGKGWGDLYLVPSSVGTTTGIAMYPYVRETRRILAHQTILEHHVGVEGRQAKYPGSTTAHQFADSIGIGAAPMDIHPTAAYPHGLHIATYPFQIPLRSMVPRGFKNVIVGGKSIGSTHLTNGCYRFHPVEWNIGESAGHALAFILGRQLPLASLMTNQAAFSQFANYLTLKGVQRSWPGDLQATPVASLG